MSQNELLLCRLRKGPITPIEALREIGVFRLAARVYDLRCKGHEIHSFTVEREGKEFAQYLLVREAK